MADRAQQQSPPPEQEAPRTSQEGDDPRNPRTPAARNEAYRRRGVYEQIVLLRLSLRNTVLATVTFGELNLITRDIDPVDDNIDQILAATLIVWNRLGRPS